MVVDVVVVAIEVVDVDVVVGVGPLLLLFATTLFRFVPDVEKDGGEQETGEGLFEVRPLPVARVGFSRCCFSILPNPN